MSIPSLSTIRCARSGCDVPLKTLMFGILLCNTPQPRGFSNFARNKLLARTGCGTGITENHADQSEIPGYYQASIDPTIFRHGYEHRFANFLFFFFFQIINAKTESSSTIPNLNSTHAFDILNNKHVFIIHFPYLFLNVFRIFDLF